MNHLFEQLDLAAEKLGIAKNNYAYKSAIEALNNPGQPIVCGKESGRGRYSSSQSWQERTAILLRAAGIVFETSNVAPKGGKAGDRITVLKSNYR